MTERISCKYIELTIIILLMLMPPLVTQAESEEKKVFTGQEVLLELSDPKEGLPSGIYAWNPAKPLDISQLKLLVKGGHYPAWSPQRTRIAYIFNGDIWILDQEGHKTAAIKNFVNKGSAEANHVLHWSPNGELYFNQQSSVKGTTVCISPSIENATTKELRELYNAPFNLTYEIRPLKDPTDDSSSGLIRSLTTFDWKNIQSSSNATFSSDGRFVAVETYPSSPMNILRHGSHIQIYEQLPVATNREEFKELTNLTKQFVDRWFHVDDAATPQLKGPGRALFTSDSTTQINPLWSPNGQQIALTLISTKKYSMIPIIVDTDGTLIANINVPNFGSPVQGEIAEAGWMPISSVNSSNKTNDENIPLPTVFRKAIGWSNDGKYLWMREKENGISALKEEGDQWMIKQVKSNNSEHKGDLFVAFGEEENKILWLEDSGDLRKIWNIHLYDIRTDKEQVYPLRSALKVFSVDW